MKQRQQSSTSYPITFLMVDSADHVTGKTGLTPTVTISKNGGAFAAPSGAVTEIGYGWYALAGNATDRGTLGDLLIHATASGADPVDDRYCIVPWDPFDAAALGLSRLDAAVSSRLASAAYSAPLDAAGTRTAVGLAAANLDAQLGDLPTVAEFVARTLPSADYVVVSDLPSITGLALEATAQAILEDTGTTLPAAIAAIDTSGMAEAVWEYTTRTLTQSSTSTTDSTAAGSIARRRGDSWSISLTIGAITGYTSLWFTAKWDRDNTDAESVLQVKKNASGSGDGLLYVNGATAANAALGSITVTDATTGAIVIAVDETVTDDLPPAGIYYDVQALVSGTVSTLDSGTLTISADVTRAVA